MLHDISYKTLIDPKPMRIRLDKIGGFIRIYDGTRNLTLFGSQKYDAVYDRIRYLISLKYKYKVASHTFFLTFFAKIKLDSYDSLPIEKILTWHNVLIQIKSVLNKNKNHCYYRIYLEKCSYQLAKK